MPRCLTPEAAQVNTNEGLLQNCRDSVLVCDSVLVNHTCTEGGTESRPTFDL